MIQQAITTNLVCDGGPSEQAAIPVLQRDLFKNAKLISRDRAHRTRSITKAVWGPLNNKCDGLLSKFTTDEHSLSRMLKRFVCNLMSVCKIAPCAPTKPRNSHKYSRIFAEVQINDSVKFSKALKNFSLAAQRFNSLSDPLFKIFHLLPNVLKFLTELTEKGDVEDARWATQLLLAVTGKRAWFKIMVAAMAGDAMMLCQKFIPEVSVQSQRHDLQARSCPSCLRHS